MPPVRTRTKEQIAAYKKQWALEHREEIRVRNREWARKWRKANPEQMQKLNRMRYRKTIARDPDAYNRRNRAWRRKNKSKHIKNVTDWQKSNMEKVRQYKRKYAKSSVGRKRQRVDSKNRRARKASATGSHTLEQWLVKLIYYGWRCWMCRKSLTEKTATEDHVIPLSKNGANWISNIRPACKSCNSKKRDRIVR